MSNDPIVLVGGARTPVGKYGGALKDIDAHQLSATAITGALRRVGIAPTEVDEVVLGEVGSVGADAYNARRSQLAAGIPTSAIAFNVNRLCSSGLQAIISGAQEILADQATVVVAGGNESMSRQPYLDYNARYGGRLGNRELIDGTMSLITDPFGDYPMGVTAENVAAKYDISRNDQDEFALRSHELALQAIDDGLFIDEIEPVPVNKSADLFSVDEHPRRGMTMASLEKLKPAFSPDGTVTAGNASGINDGAAAVVLMRQSEAVRRDIAIQFALRSWNISGNEPAFMGYAPALAIPKALERANLSLADIDIIELNEAFAAQALAVMRGAGLDEKRVNPTGGAIALGHPIGATGAILTVKLMHALQRIGGRFGVVSMCIGGGQGIAAVLERLE